MKSFFSKLISLAILLIFILLCTNGTSSASDSAYSQITPELVFQQCMQLSETKQIQTASHRKLSSDLLPLIDQAYRDKDITLEENKANLKTQKQLITANEAEYKDINDATDDLVYVYITLNVDAATDTIDPYVKKVTNRDEENGILAAWVEVNELDNIASLDVVNSIRTVIQPETRVGSVTSQGDAILKADIFRDLSGTDGTGIKIGIISDGVNNWTSAVNTGDLPGTVNVLSDSIGGDEGTAMLEIVHDLAPGAELYFHDCGDNMLAFNAGIDELVASGCKVICDDISWLASPFFEDGIVAQHIAASITDNDIIYVSSAGNAGGNYGSGHYQGLYYDGGNNLHGDSLYVNLPPGGAAIAILQWNDEFGSSSNDYDLDLWEADTANRLGSSYNIQDGSGDPIEIIYFDNNTGGDLEGEYTVFNYNGNAVPQILEIYIYCYGEGSLSTDNLTARDSIYGHQAVTGVITVGAVGAASPNQIEPFSSQGPVTMLTQTRPKPDICAVDGVAVTGAGGFYNPFYGTSAAAPHVAAIAALGWSKNPTWTADQVKAKLLEGTIDLGQSGYDSVYGNGRADVMAAFGVVTYGDVNGDASINITDAVLVLKYITDPSLGINILVADVNGDSDINITDAVLILKHITSPGEPFPVEMN